MATLSWVRGFLERMGKTAFLRAGPEPLVLSEREREARRSALALLGRTALARQPPPFSPPDLASPVSAPATLGVGQCSSLASSVLWPQPIQPTRDCTNEGHPGVDGGGVPRGGGLLPGECALATCERQLGLSGCFYGFAHSELCTTAVVCHSFVCLL